MLCLQECEKKKQKRMKRKEREELYNARKGIRIKEKRGASMDNFFVGYYVLTIFLYVKKEWVTTERIEVDMDKKKDRYKKK